MTAEIQITAAESGFTGAVNYDGLDAIGGIEHMPETDVQVSSLVPGFYLRQAGTDPAHIRLLADAAGTTKLPAILVQEGNYRIIDGMHRVEAAKLRGEVTIRARLIDCTDGEALVLAIKSNVLHGLPLTKADRISGAKRVLAAHPDWSDRAVAEISGLSAKTIASLRNRATDEMQFRGKRLGRDGRRRPLSAVEGRRRAAAYIGAHPEAPLREVAREADVSLGTVHDVRERLRRGWDCATQERGRQLAMAPVRPAEGISAPVPLPGSPLPASPLSGSPLSGSPLSGSPLSGSPLSGSLVRARVGRTPQQSLPWPRIASKLAGDPALKYTEGGRAFLRWMAARSAQADEWREFIDAIPMHWLRDVSQVAETMSAEWREFAERLRGRHAAVLVCHWTGQDWPAGVSARAAIRGPDEGAGPGPAAGKAALLTASIRETAPSLTKMLRRCRLTVASVSERRLAICRLLSASPTSPRTSRSRGDSVSPADASWSGRKLSRDTPSTIRSSSATTARIAATSSCQWTLFSR